MEHNYEILQECPSCGHKSFTDHITSKDYTYSQKDFHIQKCSNCNLLFTNPRPSISSIGEYYDNPDYVSHTDTKQGLLFKIYGAIKSYSLRRKRAFLESELVDKTLLDYGAGSGDFSNELATNDWKVFAFEPDAKARLMIQKKNDSIELVSNLSEIPNQSVNAITLWHVLEHVHDLTATLREFKRILKPSGTLIVAVPNHTSLDAQFYQEDWAAYDVPRHLYHFNPETLNPLIERIGFTLSEMKPMWFDSTYVSLLSEKNKGINPIVGWIRASLIGQVSNMQCLFDKQKCSSITYVYKKAI